MKTRNLMRILEKQMLLRQADREKERKREGERGK